MTLVRNVITDEKTMDSIHKAAEEAGISDTLMITRVLKYWGVVFDQTRAMYAPRTKEEKALAEVEKGLVKDKGRGNW